MPELRPHAALLLAAGGSKRLGEPKQLLTRDGVPLVRIMAGSLLATAPEMLVIVTGGSGRAVAEALADLDVHIVDNPDWTNGLASSLQRGVASLPPRPILIAGTDQPALTSEHLVALLHHGADGEDVVTEYTDKARGIPVFLSVATRQMINALRGDTGLRELWTATGKRPRRVRAPALGFDIDTPAERDLARAQGLID